MDRVVKIKPTQAHESLSGALADLMEQGMKTVSVVEVFGILSQYTGYFSVFAEAQASDRRAIGQVLTRNYNLGRKNAEAAMCEHRNGAVH